MPFFRFLACTVIGTIAVGWILYALLGITVVGADPAYAALLLVAQLCAGLALASLSIPEDDAPQ